MRQEDEALNETADAYSVSHGIEGQLQRERNLSRAIKIHSHLDHVPAKQGKEHDSHHSGDHVDDVPDPFGELENKEVHKNVALEKGGEGHGETNHDGPRAGSEYIGADDRSAERSQDDSRYCQEHHEGDGDSCEDIQKLAESVHLIDE
jgi:hypothetical protein